MATVRQPTAERDDGDLETSTAQEAVLHGREIFGLRHGGGGNGEYQLKREKELQLEARFEGGNRVKLTSRAKVS